MTEATKAQIKIAQENIEQTRDLLWAAYAALRTVDLTEAERDETSEEQDRITEAGQNLSEVFTSLEAKFRDS